MIKKDSQGYTESQRLTFLRQHASNSTLINFIRGDSSMDGSSILEKELVKMAKDFSIPVNEFENRIQWIAEKIIRQKGSYNG